MTLGIKAMKASAMHNRSEKKEFIAAFEEHGIGEEKKVVWADEMRLGLRGQVRKVGTEFQSLLNIADRNGGS